MCIAPSSASAAAAAASGSAHRPGGISRLQESLNTGSIGNRDGTGISGSMAAAQGLNLANQFFQTQIMNKQAQRQSAIARLENLQRSRDRARTRDAVLGQQMNQYGASGITLSGTPTTVISRTAGDFAGQQFVDDLNTRFQIELIEQQRKSARRQAFIGMAGSLLSVFGGGSGGGQAE